MKTALLYAALGAMAVFAGIALVQRFQAVEADISIHGWIAMAAGGALSLLLAAGLMALTFFSARRGYDDRPPHHNPD